MPALSGRRYGFLKARPVRLARSSEGLIISQAGIGVVVGLVIVVRVRWVVGGVSGILVGTGGVVKLACDGAPCNTLGGPGRGWGRRRRRGCVVVVMVVVGGPKVGGGTPPRIAAGRSKDPCRVIHVLGLSTGSEMQSSSHIAHEKWSCPCTVDCNCNLERAGAWRPKLNRKQTKGRKRTPVSVRGRYRMAKCGRRPWTGCECELTIPAPGVGRQVGRKYKVLMTGRKRTGPNVSGFSRV